MEPIKETRTRPLLSVSRLTCRVPKISNVPEDGKVQLPTLFRHRNASAASTGAAEGGLRILFADLAFTLDAGDIVDLIGPSGAGKSTLLTAVARLNPHATAMLTLDGRSSDDMSPDCGAGRWPTCRSGPR